MTEERFECVAEVTQDRINRGVRCDPECCPIALALQEQLPSATFIDVTTFGIGLTLAGTLYEAESTLQATKFIEDFDSSSDAQPTSIRLEFERIVEDGK